MARILYKPDHSCLVSVPTIMKNLKTVQMTKSWSILIIYFLDFLSENRRGLRVFSIDLWFSLWDFLVAWVMRLCVQGLMNYFKQVKVVSFHSFSNIRMFMGFWRLNVECLNDATSTLWWLLLVLFRLLKSTNFNECWRVISFRAIWILFGIHVFLFWQVISCSIVFAWSTVSRRFMLHPVSLVVYVLE